MTGKPNIGIPATRDRDRIAGDGLSTARCMNQRRTDAAAALRPYERCAEQHASIEIRRNSFRNSRPHIDQRGDVNPMRSQITRRTPTVIIIGEDKNLSPHRHRKAVSVSARRGRHHDAGTIITAEHDRALDGAGSEHRSLRHDSPKPLPRLMGRRDRSMVRHPLECAVNAIIVTTENRRPRHQPHILQTPQARRSRTAPKGLPGAPSTSC